MLWFIRLNEELTLMDLELASREIPKFYGQNDKFMGCFSKWNKSLLVTTSMTEWSLRWLFQDYKQGCAIQWWKSHKFKRTKKGKEKGRTQKKLRSKLRVAFCPTTHILKHVPLLPKKNGSKSSCMDLHINKGSSNHSPPTPSTPQKIQTPQINFPLQIKPQTNSQKHPKMF